MSAWRTWLALFLTCTAAIGLAAAARHWLIEPVSLSQRCDAGLADAWCAVRWWTIQAFVQQRIGWFALTLALLASIGARRGVAAVALIAAGAGLVLYSAELCAPAALLALLVFARRRPATLAASSSNSAQNASA